MCARMHSLLVVSGLVLAVVAMLSTGVPAQVKPPKASLPAVLTSAGQSPDAFTIGVLCERAGINIYYDSLMKVNKLEGAKTLLFAMGGSAKGLGAAGIDEEDELARIKILLDRAKVLKLFVVGIHVGGEARRGPLSEEFIEATAPRCNYLIIKEDGNQDGYFTKIGAELKIPVTVVQETLQVVNTLKEMFQLK